MLLGFAGPEVTTSRMTVPVQPSLFATTLRSRRRRPAVLALLAVLLLAQTLLVVHGIDHIKAERGAPCALCMASDHLAGGAPSFAHYVPPQAPDVITAVVSGSVTVAFRAAYRSRAPPPHLQS
jgi:hypothetical protein